MTLKVSRRLLQRYTSQLDAEAPKASVGSAESTFRSCHPADGTACPLAIVRECTRATSNLTKAAERRSKCSGRSKNRNERDGLGGILHFCIPKLTAEALQMPLVAPIIYAQSAMRDMLPNFRSFPPKTSVMHTQLPRSLPLKCASSLYAPRQAAPS